MIFIYVFYIDIFLKQNFLMNFLVLSLTCVFCKSAVCHRNLRMLAAAVSGTGLEAFGLMVLPYAISVLCTAIGIVPLMVFLAFGREIKTEDGEDFKQLVIYCIVKRSGNCSLQSDGTGKSVSVYRTGNGRNHLRTCQKSCGVGAEAKATDVCGSV